MMDDVFWKDECIDTVLYGLFLAYVIKPVETVVYRAKINLHTCSLEFRKGKNIRYSAKKQRLRLKKRRLCGDGMVCKKEVEA